MDGPKKLKRYLLYEPVRHFLGVYMKGFKSLYHIAIRTSMIIAAKFNSKLWHRIGIYQ